MALYLNDTYVRNACFAKHTGGIGAEYHYILSPDPLGLTRNEFFVDPSDPEHELEAHTFSSGDTPVVLHDCFGPDWEELPVDVELWTPLNNYVYSTDESGVLPPGATIQLAAEAMQCEWECELVMKNMTPGQAGSRRLP